jgi:hypothetical protein
LSFKVVPRLDETLINQEDKGVKTSKVPAVWPSAASAPRLIDTELSKIVGECHRKSYYRLTGQPTSSKPDPVQAWRWVTGRSIEEHVGHLTEHSDPKLFVASGIRLFIEDLIMPYEIDMVVRDPETNTAWIVECKTFYGYMAAKELLGVGGGPKLENLMQVCMYLIEVNNGANLKKLVKKSLAEKVEQEAKGIFRNRCEADLELLEQIDDGPVGAKLVYIARDDCRRTEFDISITQDFDGFHYPCVNGIPYKIFTLESIFDRYRLLQEYWFRARREAVNRLNNKGVYPPSYLHLPLYPADIAVTKQEEEFTDEQKDLINNYYLQLENEVRILPDDFLPPAEYDFSYNDKKIETLFNLKKIGKIAYGKYKKGKLSRLGDWQCSWCPYAATCVPKVYPQLSYIFHSAEGLKEDEVEFEE